MTASRTEPRRSAGRAQLATGLTPLGRVREYRWRVAFTYALTLIENVFELLYPFAAGLAIDGLLAGSGWRSLVPFAAIWLAHIATGAARQLYDTRLFSRVYTDVAGSMVARQRAAGVPTGDVAARATMMGEVVDFVEVEVPAIVAAVISVLGGITMLLLYDAPAGVALAALLLPIAAIHLRYGRRAVRLSRHLNDRREREVDAIADGRMPKVQGHFRSLAHWRVKLSDAQVRAWSAAELFALAAVLVVLLRITRAPGVAAGDIVAAFAYSLTVLHGLGQLPGIVDKLARLVDIRRRVAADPGQPEPDPAVGDG